MKWWKSSLILIACVAAGGCKSGSGKATVMLSTSAANVILQNTFQFSAAVTGSSDTTVTWKVNDITGGNAMLGTISTNGLYTAPAAIPNPATAITVKAVSNANSSAFATATVTLFSGVTISLAPVTATMGTGEMLTLTATFNGTTSNGVDWFVAPSATGTFTAGGSSTLGTIPTMTTTMPATCGGTVCTTGVFTAPATAPTGGSVVVKAQSVVDVNQTALVTVTIVTATDPTFTSVTPTLTGAGSVFQDFYLIGTNFLSTTSAIIAGNAVPTTLVNPTTLRARAPASLLTSVRPLTVRVQRQGGVPIGSLSVNVVAVRPALVSAFPESAPAGPGTVTYEFDGGYFGSGVTGEFDNQPQVAISPSTPNPQQLLVSIGNGSLMTPGLFSVDVNNPAAMPQRSAVNIALQPTGMPAVPIVIGSGVLNQPISVAVDTALGIAAVVNQGSSGVNSNSLSLVDLASKMITATFRLGNTPMTGLQPTAIAVDNEKDRALVTNSASSDVAVVDLVTHAVTMLTGVGTAPFGVGVDPIHQRALVVNQSTNMATVIDLTTLPAGSPATTACGAPVVCSPVGISTGPAPNVAVLPRLGWAIVTPGGAGTLSVVDLVRKAVVFTASVSVTVVGAAVNTETERVLLTDPNSSFVTVFSLQDEAVSNASLELGHTAAAVNPLTNIGVTVNDISNAASIIDLSTPARVATVTVGSNPRAVAIDPGTDMALVVNQNDNTISIIDLGALTTHPQIVQMDPPLTMTSGSALPLTLIGSGFAPGAMVRFNETTTVAPLTVTPRKITALMPASLLTQANRIIVDVANGAAGPFSNVENLVVIQPVTVGTNPQAVAIDPQREIAVVTNTTSNNVSVVDVNPAHIGTYGTVLSTITVGTSPAGVAVFSGTGQAVVANEGNGTVSVLDLVTDTVTATVSTGGQPRGVAINPATGFAYVSNSVSNSLSAFSLTATGTPVPSTVAVDRKPGAIAIAPDLNILALATETDNDLMMFDISTPGTLVLRNRFTGLSLPTGVVYDPVSQVFAGLSSLGNNLVISNPTTFQSTTARVGINPTSVAYNFQTSTLLTINTASHTLSVMDFPNRRVRSILSLAGGSQFSVDIHPRTNIAAVVDTANNRLLLVPMPR